MQIINPRNSLAQKMASLLAVGCLSLLLALTLLSSPAGAAVIISDDFTAADGTPLGGRTTPVGGATWTDYTQAGGTPVIESNGVTFTSTAYGYFSVPFSVGSYTSFEVQANLWPRGNNMNLSFATTSTAFQSTPQMTLWGAINAFGGWGLYQGTTLVSSGGGLTAGSTSYGDAILRYDVPTTTLSFIVNNVQLYSGVVTSFNPADITTAGISYYAMSTENTNPQVTSFALVAAPVPEPATVTLLALGGLALFMRRKFRQHRLAA